jgi:hypothetical protein
MASCKFTTIDHVKYVCDGAETIDEMVAHLKAQITWLERMKSEGWVLSEKVSDGWTHFYRKRDGETCNCECCYYEESDDDDYDDEDDRSRDDNESVS